MQMINDNPDEPWDWESISCNPNITEQVICDNPTKPWNWEHISKNPNLMFPMIIENLDKGLILYNVCCFNSLETQKCLLEAWEKDAHIRNLKKIQYKGTAAVHSYIQTNLPNEFTQMPSSSNRLGMSVGFDSRKRN